MDELIAVILMLYGVAIILKIWGDIIYWKHFDEIIKLLKQIKDDTRN